MKLKCQPEDFRVEELTAARPAAKGRFVFYRLTKTDLGTIEAVEVICRRWNLAARQVSYAGLKDRHAVTEESAAANGKYVTEQKCLNSSRSCSVNCCNAV